MVVSPRVLHRDPDEPVPSRSDEERDVHRLLARANRVSPYLCVFYPQ